jgi:hypothetical protein
LLDNYTATWRAVLKGTAMAAPPPATPGVESTVTVADGLPPGPHVLELRGENLREELSAARFYSPPNAAPKAP